MCYVPTACVQMNILIVSIFTFVFTLKLFFGKDEMLRASFKETVSTLFFLDFLDSIILYQIDII